MSRVDRLIEQIAYHTASLSDLDELLYLIKMEESGELTVKIEEVLKKMPSASVSLPKKRTYLLGSN